MTLSLVRRALTLLLTMAIAACGAASSASSTPDRATTAVPPLSPLTTPSPAPSRDIMVRAGEAWIVYQGSAGGPPRIRLVRPDGTGDHELTPGTVPGDQAHPDWSHDGQRVAFAVVRSDGVRDLWVADADGSDARMVYECRLPCTEADDPAWSPDDTRLAFHQFNAVGTEGLGTGSVQIVDIAAGTNETAFIGAETEYLYDPRWNSSGTQIVFENDRFDSARLDASVILDSTVGTIDLTEKVRTFKPVLPWGSHAVYPDWHPFEDRIVIQLPTSSSDPLGPADLHTVDLGNGGQARVTDFGTTGGWAIQPTWTSDGKRIMFVGEDVVRTRPNAATIRADGTGQERMAWDGTHRTHPRLRPTP